MSDNNKGKKLSRNEINARFARVSGHLNATMRMAEDGRDLNDVIIQLAAVEASLRSLKKDMIRHYFNSSLYDDVSSPDVKLKKLEQYINHILK